MTTKQAVHLTLGQIGKNGLDGVVCEATSLPAALRSIGLDKLTSTTLKRVVAELHRQKLVEIIKGKKQLKIQLSVKGIHRLQRSQLDTVNIPQPVKWDGSWRMVTYDVPRTKAAQRRLFVDQLKRLGFTMVRESVWFHPYPCFDQLSELLSYTGLERSVTLAEISRLDTVTLGKLRRAHPTLV